MDDKTELKTKEVMATVDRYMGDSLAKPKVIGIFRSAMFNKTGGALQLCNAGGGRLPWEVSECS
eukprot:CAMPEP_0170588192 /NCGR_PEP_ID=MMETSP0224-20130122/10700_1 /TAXON_ID=285029 /ORGANISM="Togula jolla, Strain CCCM 725" /LENGTH=63 /DNA_ID=CAMNT_0010911895 /DNA_START=35 /DNA_END=226 /DNA_ORIENTATION=-